MLMASDRMLRAAQRGGYAVGAFDLVGLETGQAMIEAAESVQAPIILMIWEGGSIVPHGLWMPALRQMAEAAGVPVAIILDHGLSPQIVRESLAMGCTGVMYDGSTLPYEENVRITAELTREAHAAGVGMEAEIGHVGEAYDMSTCLLTEPEDAVRFVRETGVDALAVAIGTAHGAYHGRPSLDFERLATIRRLVDVPLVLHGGSGTPREDLRRCVEMGMSKINIYTDLVQGSIGRLRGSVERNEDLLDWLQAINAGVREVTAGYLELFGAAGRADTLRGLAR